MHQMAIELHPNCQVVKTDFWPCIPHIKAAKLGAGALLWRLECRC